METNKGIVLSINFLSSLGLSKDVSEKMIKAEIK
jgi:hypothetical protein